MYSLFWILANCFSSVWSIEFCLKKRMNKSLRYFAFDFTNKLIANVKIN